MMLTYNNVLCMFQGIRQAAKEGREPTKEEIVSALWEGQQVLASIVDSLTAIATYTNKKED